MKIYSMPEAFLLDQHVPARWRLLGIINGFHINGKDFYASNEWIARQLNCSENTVSNATKELELLGEIHCVRTRNSRLIKRATKPDPNQLGSAPQPTGVSDPNQLGTIAISNSLSKRTADADIVEVSEKEESLKKEKDPQVVKAAKYWHSLCRKEIGQEPSGGLVKTMAIIKRARGTLTWPQVKQVMDDWFNSETLAAFEMIQITRCLSPLKIDKFVSENV